MPTNLLRNLPSVNELLDSPQLKSLVERANRNVVVARVRNYLDDLRIQVQSAASEIKVPSVSELAEKIAQRILAGEEPRLRPVINATGMLLHPELGRSPLAADAIDELVGVARDYASLEIDLASGEPARRALAVEELLQELTGAEAALVVNNNAGATLLALAALAEGREVIVSRGQLIEMDGNFRLPEVIHASGAVLCEVGSTNKTGIDDFRQAIGERTAALMLVHTSQYVVVGCSGEVGLAELVGLGRERQIPVIHDIGSGSLVDLSEIGLSREPQVRESIRAGADLVLFSGDKLLGGPQCGIVVGRRDLIAKMSGHPLMRALRVDKLTLAALVATLRLYRDPARARREVPLLQLLGTSIDNLKNRAERLAPQLAACEAIGQAEACEGSSDLGWTAPAQRMPSWCIALTSAKEGGVERLAMLLRTGHPAVAGRIDQGRLLLDLRSVFPRQDQLLVEAAIRLGSRPAEPS